ncbi:SET domain-containing protein 3 [Escovopsis weberi]|uniref:SET domain-containing protein 3 n=1 Tax=Escovopsis weberi TaxID=150374 RepID=A0A0M8N0C4_ESCWE|nr:SET domain-containing protein 3 [Escovopsis weberi]
MTDKLAVLSTQAAVSSQANPPGPVDAIPNSDVIHHAEAADEEPYTIKCICKFKGDDGNTIYCETCDTWQHIDCFYPDNREEAIREDFAHSCADCNPRPLNRQKAIERVSQLGTSKGESDNSDKKTKRTPSKSHKKKSKPSDAPVNGHFGSIEGGKHASSNDPHHNHHPSKKSKTSHRPSLSLSSQPPKRSPSFGHPRSNPTHPPSPATTPPDLPDDFQIHHYSAGFCALYNELDVPDSHNNAFASLAIPTALSRWLREPDVMKQEVGRTRAEVFQDDHALLNDSQPKLEVKDTTRSIDPSTILRWRFVKSTVPIDKDVPLIELNGEIGFQKDYCADVDNLWADLSSPLPFVFFHPVLPLYIDTRKEGSLARFVRRSCKPNAQLDTFLTGGSEYHFWLVSDRYIPAHEQITLPWDFRLEKSVCAKWLHLLGLSEDDGAAQDEFDLDESEYTAISNWIDRILSEYGGCACNLENNCAFARFHRHYLFGKSQARNAKKRSRTKPRPHTVSPTETSHATNSRSASEGRLDDMVDKDVKDDVAMMRGKPPLEERPPPRQGSFDQLGILTEPTDRDKRKVAMVEDSFRRMEQQQQPPRKKKRVSDGTPSASSKNRSRNPSSAPTPGAPPPAGPRPAYCDAGTQTDPVPGVWFSEPAKSVCPPKRIISLSKRLLSHRHKWRADLERRLSISSVATAADVAVETTPQILEEKLGFLKPIEEETSVPMDSQAGDAEPPAVPAAEPPTVGDEKDESLPQAKMADLRIETSSVPILDTSGASGSKTTSPLSTTSPITTPAAAPGSLSGSHSAVVNGPAVNPSPIKKKLTLSDYTKSRMNKTAIKSTSSTVGPASAKTSPAEDIKIEVTAEPMAIDKVDGVSSPSAKAAPANM